MAWRAKDTLYVVAAAYDDVDAAGGDDEGVEALYREVRTSHDFAARGGHARPAGAAAGVPPARCRGHPGPRSQTDRSRLHPGTGRRGHREGTSVWVASPPAGRGPPCRT